MTRKPPPVDNAVPGRAARWRSHDRRRAALAVLCVVTLHGALLWRWQGALTGPARPAGLTPPLRVTLRLIPPRPAPLPTPLPRRPETPFPAATVRLPVATLSRPRLPPPASAAPAAAAPLNRSVISITPPEAAASAALAELSLLDTEASRRAIRASARTPSLSALAAAASEEPRPASAQERLGDGVKAAGKGDCLKGEYAGAGMGILSLPLIALAAARGACAH